MGDVAMLSVLLFVGVLCFASGLSLTILCLRELKQYLGSKGARICLRKLVQPLCFGLPGLPHFCLLESYCGTLLLRESLNIDYFSVKRRLSHRQTVFRFFKGMGFCRDASEMAVGQVN